MRSGVGPQIDLNPVLYTGVSNNWVFTECVFLVETFRDVPLLQLFKRVSMRAIYSIMFFPPAPQP